ncbi:hypothetical protein AEQ67_20050 [Pseudomonas sp. RIT-PI-q]|uniref:hypothetical protein n=1 Tax=Pseudomonas sp. RIT-PI-q TaxID=1690247 RepID=UPI0006CDDD2C|nr:hypothetical protein [Pseudomonas sp. RIT-PI-q]KPG95522.1 hypothetical protein AEQ67_20050 [Pseudomonas sp. RIT-PI-q]
MSQVSLGLISFFILVPLILIEFWLIYMVHVYTEKAEALMPNSRFVEDYKGMFSHAGLMGKAMRNGLLTLVLLTPNLTAKRGLVDISEVKNFPRKLKRILVVSWGLCFLFFVALVIFGSYLKYMKYVAGVHMVSSSYVA